MTEDDGERGGFHQMMMDDYDIGGWGDWGLEYIQFVFDLERKYSILTTM